MKKFALLSILLLMLSACSIGGGKNNITYNNNEFNIEKYNENFELEIEENTINNVGTEIQIIPVPKKFANFSDIDLGFSFLYPDNDKIIEDKNSNPIRIQNYELGNKSLNVGDFYIEIFYFDPSITCEDKLHEISSTYNTNGINITRGYGIEGEDKGLTKNALCFKKGGKTIYISYTENGNTNVNTIFNSLQIQ